MDRRTPGNRRDSLNSRYRRTAGYTRHRKSKVRLMLIPVVALILLSVFLLGKFILAHAVEALMGAAEPIAQLPVIGGGGENAAVWQGKERVNILLLGIDHRPDETDPSRTDTMELFTIDPVSKTAGMLGIPRDMWVKIPGTPPLQSGPWEQGKINTANFYGDLYKYPGGGPALAKKTVESVLGIKIQYVARIDFTGFVKIIDSVGGVDVNVEKPLKDDEYPTADYGTKRIFFQAGLQHMDGETALEYVRSRHQDTDFGRMQRQQQVLSALRERALSVGMLSKVPSLLGDLKDMISTDLSPGEILGLLKLASEVDTKNMTTAAIDQSCCVSDFYASDGEQALWPDQKAIDKLVGDFLSPSPVVTPTQTINKG